MKSKFLRILALILVMSSLLSMFTIFASAAEAGAEEEEPKEETTLNLVYNRTFEEGWDIKNGMSLTDQGSTGSTTFNIEYEETADFKYNYFMRLELNSTDNDFVQLSAGSRNVNGAVFEVDVKSDDVCNFVNVLTFGTKGSSSAERSDYKFLTVENNQVYLMKDTVTGAAPAFELTNEWTRIQIVFDFTYEYEPVLEGDSDDEIFRKSQVNDKWFQAYIYYGDPSKPTEMTLFTGAPLTLEARSGKGIAIFRFQSTGGDKKEDFGTGICFDNMKFYDGVNYPVEITPDMGYGTEVNPSTPKTVEIKGGNTAASSKEDIRAALSMKVGVDYCFINKTRQPIATTADGTAYGAPVKIDTLARNLIRLSGLTPDVDIKIEYTGLRAGEKLYEEKLMSEEGMRTTPNHLIHIGSPIPFETDEFLEQLQTLMTLAYDGEDEKIRASVADVVGTYHPAGEHGTEYKGTAYAEQMELVAKNELDTLVTA